MSFQDKLRSYAILFIINAIAVAAFVVLALTVHRDIGYALVALALVGLVWRSRRSGFGDTITAQALVAAAIFADAFPDGPTAGLIVAATLVGLIIINQPVPPSIF